MTRAYDYEAATIRVKCTECGHENDVDVRADVEIDTYLTIKEK